MKKNKYDVVVFDPVNCLAGVESYELPENIDDSNVFEELKKLCETPEIKLVCIKSINGAEVWNYGRSN